MFRNQFCPDPCMLSFTPFHSSSAWARISFEVTLMKAKVSFTTSLLGVGGT